MKKFTALFILLLSTFLLVGCNPLEVFNQDKIKNINLEDAISERAMLEYTFDAKHEIILESSLDRQIISSGSSNNAILFSDGRVFSFLTEQEFKLKNLDDVYSANQTDQYFYITTFEGYSINSLETGEELRRLPNNGLSDYYFLDDHVLIIRYDEYGNVIKQEKIQFEDYKIVEETDPNFAEIEYDHEAGDFGIILSLSSGEIIVYKNEKLHYVYEIRDNDSVESIYFLENGNILIKRLSQLPSTAENYNLIMGSTKYILKYELFDIAKKNIKEVNYNYYIEGIFYQKEVNNKNQNQVLYRNINKDSRQIESNYSFMIVDNNFKKFYTINFDFGTTSNLAGEMIPFDSNTFVYNTGFAVFVINGKNKTQAQFIYDPERFAVDAILDSKHILVREFSNSKTYVIEIATGEVIHQDLVVHTKQQGFYILRNEDGKLFKFDTNGGLTSLRGDNLNKLSNGFYSIQVDDNIFFYNPLGEEILEISFDTFYTIRYIEQEEKNYLMIHYNLDGIYQQLIVSSTKLKPLQ